MPPRVLIVAGSDSGGGAGIQADIKAVTMMGGHAMTAIAALTAQNTLGVHGVHAVPAGFVLAQIDAVADDIGADAVKIGMIGSAETAEAVTARLEAMESVPLVFDPVMIATSGAVLADRDTIRAFERLMRRATLVTPNLPELEALTGARIADAEGLEAAGRALAARTGAAVLAKGGHLPGDRLTDILIRADGTSGRWEGERIVTEHSHGTGCTLASAIACGLGAGATLEASIGEARAYVRAALAAAPGFGRGHGPIGHTLGLEPFASRFGGSTVHSEARKP